MTRDGLAEAIKLIAPWSWPLGSAFVAGLAWCLFSLSIQARCETFADASAALERYHHEEDVIGSRCGREFGRFRSLARLRLSALLFRTRRLSVLFGLCRCTGWRSNRPLLLAYPALLGRLCLAGAPRAHLRLIRSRLFRRLTKEVADISATLPLSGLQRRA